jgi:hypothetical protein
VAVTSREFAVISACVATIVVSADFAAQARPPTSDPFAFFSSIVTITPAERQRIDAGDVLVRVLPASGNEVAVFAASRLDDDAESVVRWTEAIEQLKQGPFVRAIKRFSDPPLLSDLDSLTLDDVDLEEVAKCRVGDCGIKLGAPEIQMLKAAAGTDGDWKLAVQRSFRRVVFERVCGYRSEGVASLPPYVDRSQPVLPRDQFAGILNRSPYLQRNLPSIAGGLVRYPQVELPHTQSFVYWSKEHYGSGKPVVAVTQVHVVRPMRSDHALPTVAIFAHEIFASHYRDGSLGATFVLESGNGRYLAYVNRSSLDALDGMLGGLKRRLVERRLESDMKTAIDAVRRRIETSDPS